MSSDCNKISTSKSPLNDVETGPNNSFQPRSNSRRIVPRKVQPENARNKPHPSMKDQYDLLVDRDGLQTLPVWKYCHIIKEFKDPLYREKNHDTSGPRGVHK